jgi:hypothetical protein
MLEHGRALAASVRAPMERALGQSFADVHVHSDAAAGALTALLHADAVTAGNRIMLADGIDASSHAGRIVLAHELIHVAQHRAGGFAPGMPASAQSESEARAQASPVAAGAPTTVRHGSRAALACSDEDHWWSRLRRHVAERVREETGEALGTVEGVVMEVATTTDTMMYAATRSVNAIDAAVDRAGAAAHLPPHLREVASQVVTDVVMPAAPAIRALQASAARAGYVDSVTGAPTVAPLVTRAADVVDAARQRGVDYLAGQHLGPETGLLTSRELGQLRGAIGLQALLAEVGAEEVQLVLRATAEIGMVQAIDRAVNANRQGWPRDPAFWTAVGQAVIYLIGLRGSQVGNRLLQIVADFGSGVLSSSDSVAQLQTDYDSYHGADREARIRHDIQGVIRTVAQGIINAINHANRVRQRPSRPTPDAPAPSPAAPAGAATPAATSQVPRATVEHVPTVSPTQPAAEPAGSAPGVRAIASLADTLRSQSRAANETGLEPHGVSRVAVGSELAPEPAGSRMVAIPTAGGAAAREPVVAAHEPPTVVPHVSSDPSLTQTPTRIVTEPSPAEGSARTSTSTAAQTDAPAAAPRPAVRPAGPILGPREFVRQFHPGHHVPEGTIIRVQSEEAANFFVRQLSGRDPGREIEIFRTPTGDHYVVQGHPNSTFDETAVAQRLGVDPTDLTSVAHTHPPNDPAKFGGRARADQMQQVPSVRDLGSLRTAAQRLGRQVESLIHFRMRNGRWGRTLFGAKPDGRCYFRILDGPLAGAGGEFPDNVQPEAYAKSFALQPNQFVEIPGRR